MNGILAINAATCAGNAPQRFARLVVTIVTIFLAGLCAQTSRAQDSEQRCVILELYIRNNDAACKKAVDVMRKLEKSRSCVRVNTYNLDEKGKHVDRFQQILKYFRVKQAKVPVVYGCRYLLMNLKDPQTLRQQVDAALTVNVFVRDGCPRCAAAKEFLAKIKPRYPCFKFVEYEVTRDKAALQRLMKLAERYNTRAASLPGIHFCNELSIGFISEETTGRRIESVLKYWTVPCKQAEKKGGANDNRRSSLDAPDEQFVSLVGDGGSHRSSRGVDTSPAEKHLLTTVYSVVNEDSQTDSRTPPGSGVIPDSPVPPKTGNGPIAPGPPPTEALPPPPPGPDGHQSSDGQERPPPAPVKQDKMNVPVFGELDLRQLGMPAFTFLVGLADGFNPCAMWVLLFLLSVLVNLKSRVKILAVAGTFVVISGLAYYAFMAAWLNVFLFVGYLRWVQVTLGLTAVVVGTIHIKDFFAFKRGISLSIPESAKPTIYERVRRIVSAKNLWAAILGASVLAVLVNIVELLCTAGLPALYTQILMLQEYPAWKNYVYLGLYIIAYMLDDSLMVGAVVITLGRRKMQERHGRWLKLISGAVIALLGLVMIFKPEWLV